MYCEILSTLYVKSNGDIPCHDDYGERIILTNLNESPTIDKIIASKQFNSIERRLSSSSIPWENICDKCAFFRPDQNFENRIRQFHINKIQIESSLACSLNCWGCSRREQVKQRRGNLLLDLKNFETLMISCAEQNYNVEWIEYCGQGEPLSHPKFSQFLKIVSEVLPNTKQRLITNANYDFNACIGEETLHEIIVSSDGASQETYEIYRSGGSFEKCIRFMTDAIRRKSANNNPSVVWKYILFDHNDSDEEITKANKIAQTIGVDRLLFVLTHSKGKSKRYTNENFINILNLAPSALINFTPIQNSDTYLGYPTDNSLPDQNKEQFLFCLDEIKMLDKQHLLLKGWVSTLDFLKINRLNIVANSQSVGQINVSEKRNDVLQYFNAKGDLDLGFASVIKTTQLDPNAILCLEITPQSFSKNFDTKKYHVSFKPLRLS